MQTGPVLLVIAILPARKPITAQHSGERFSGNMIVNIININNIHDRAGIINLVQRLVWFSNLETGRIIRLVIRQFSVLFLRPQNLTPRLTNASVGNAGTLYGLGFPI